MKKEERMYVRLASDMAAHGDSSVLRELAAHEAHEARAREVLDIVGNRRPDGLTRERYADS